MTTKATERNAAAKAALETACASQAVRLRGGRSATWYRLPNFKCHHEGASGVLHEGVFRRVGTHKETTGAVQALFASEAFEWDLCGGGRLYATRGITGIELRGRMLSKVCPHYTQVCGNRWGERELVKEEQGCLDFAFLAGVWRYSRALGASFPDGLPDCCPPPPTYV